MFEILMETGGRWHSVVERDSLESCHTWMWMYDPECTVNMMVKDLQSGLLVFAYDFKKEVKTNKINWKQEGF